MNSNSLPSFLRLQGVSKHYGGVTALDSVNFACSAASIHAVLGENGAGKSTLIKIIAGAVRPNEGKFLLGEREVNFGSPIDAAREGIACIFQELSLMPDLSIADNICITNPPQRFGLIDGRAQCRRAEQLLARVGCEDLHPLELVKNLPLSRRQMVEIAKALGRNPKLLILDEATSALTAADVEKVYAILRQLRDAGMAILYISHRMHEIKALADTCSVFRNGRHIETFTQGSRSDEEIVRLMIGRELKLIYPPKPQRGVQDKAALQVRDLGWQDRLAQISLTVGHGEIVGLGGLDGQGQREFLLALFGVLSGVQGSVEVDGEAVQISGPAKAKAMKLGMALLPEDRKPEGLMLPMSIRVNL
jgi:ribose transport system ATP-binding protein